MEGGLLAGGGAIDSGGGIGRVYSTCIRGDNFGNEDCMAERQWEASEDRMGLWVVCVEFRLGEGL